MRSPQPWGLTDRTFADYDDAEAFPTAVGINR